MILRLSPWRRLRHGLIRSRWRRWFLPSLCALPYVASIVWLLLLGEGWIAQVLLAPLLMGSLLGLLSLWLAREEFHR
ncbi:hypothetical protein [Synechococcus sp. CS-197]|uniref:hypothetical protein n=1 Tax=Synechococcus sp. CS-197 TaxID=2847985 RepID=UPI0002E85197|nr:hypothetical protein [Synechococcus sp. CS-197]MCT0250839.1 hypothetical protein [Synechococcus sp. CS-197]PTU00916.1 hypothetical protein DBR45_20250 [Pseudomonas sp. HMWF031]